MHINRRKYISFIVENKKAGTKIKMTRRDIQMMLFDNHKMNLFDLPRYSSDELGRRAFSVNGFSDHLNKLANLPKI